MSDYAVTCPSCKQLISKQAKRCPNCGYQNDSFGKFNFFVLNINASRLIIICNIFFYLFALFLTFFFTDANTFFRSWFNPSNVVLQLLGWSDPTDVFNEKVWRLLSATFLHAGLLHIVFNMLWLYQFYPQTESQLGKIKTFNIYILSGIFGNFVAMLLGSSPVIGASGAVFGIFAAFIAATRHSSNIMLRVLSKRYGMFLIIILVIGFLIPGISNLSHLGGGIFGFTAGTIITKRNFHPIWSTIIFYFTTAITIITFIIMLWQVINLLIF